MDVDHRGQAGIDIQTQRQGGARRTVTTSTRRAIRLLVLTAVLVVTGYAVVLAVETTFYKRKNLHQVLHANLYASDDVPKRYIRVDRERRFAYYRAVVAGKRKAMRSRVVFCVLARNIAPNFALLKRRIEHTARFFGQFAVVFFENDSNDGTRALLKEWSRQMERDPSGNRVHVIECPDAPDCRFGVRRMYEYGEFSSCRMRHMADYRNRYVAFVRRHLADFDYVVTVDGDMRGPWSTEGLMHAIGQPEAWDAIACTQQTIVPGTFAGVRGSGDSLAFVDRDGQCLPRKPWRRFKFAARYYLLTSTWSKRFACGQPLYPVLSAFNGLAIYRMPAFLAGTYGTDLCEHVGFHLSMAANGYSRIFMDPALLLFPGPQGHTLKSETFGMSDVDPAREIEKLVRAIPPQGRVLTAAAAL